jgi:surface antigen
MNVGRGRATHAGGLVLIDSGVFAWLRGGEPPLALGTLVVTAFLAVMGTQSTAEAPSASADASDTVEVQTQGMTDANQTSHHDGSYNRGHQLTLVCSKRGQDATDTLEAAAPECNPAPTGLDGEAAPVADAGRATGRTQGVNPGTEGQCTWGAAQKWLEASGSYPALRGDAMSWSDAATAAGWTVTDDAQDRSIVVFEPGVVGAGSVGHVAWVDSVSQRPDGRWIHVTEMNNSYLGGAGIFNERDVRDVPGMSYILLP